MAFIGCTSLKSVTIPEGVTSIGGSAFSGCTSLKSVTIPSSVTSIYSTAFNSCSSLTAINVDSSNAHYSSLNGVLFDKAQTQLVCYPAGKTGEYTILEGVTYIYGSAFSDCTGLTSIILPSSITSIGGSAFSGCTMTSITIPEGVTSIGNYAFSSWTSSQTIYVQGKVNEEAAVAAWGYYWALSCSAAIVYVP